MKAGEQKKSLQLADIKKIVVDKALIIVLLFMIIGVV